MEEEGEGEEGYEYSGYDPPASLAEITAYVEENDLNVDPERFFYRYGAVGWVGSDGKPIIRWKPLIRRWSDKEWFDWRSFRKQNC